LDYTAFVEHFHLYSKILCAIFLSTHTAIQKLLPPQAHFPYGFAQLFKLVSVLTPLPSVSPALNQSCRSSASDFVPSHMVSRLSRLSPTLFPGFLWCLLVVRKLPLAKKGFQDLIHLLHFYGLKFCCFSPAFLFYADTESCMYP